MLAWLCWPLTGLGGWSTPGPDGNPWVLYASVPSGVINFDEFLFLPNQNYPERDYGGRFQRLGRWAYYHE